MYSQFSLNRLNRQLQRKLGGVAATPGIFQVSPVTYESSILFIACAVVLLTVFRRQKGYGGYVTWKLILRGTVMPELNRPWRILLQRMDYARDGINPRLLISRSKAEFNRCACASIVRFLEKILRVGVYLFSNKSFERRRYNLYNNEEFKEYVDFIICF